MLGQMSSRHQEEAFMQTANKGFWKLIKRTKTHNHSPGAAHRRKARLVMEGLETRDLMAAGPVYDAASHTINIYGTQANDSVSVDYGTTNTSGTATKDSSKIVVSFTSEGTTNATTFTASGVQHIVFYGKNGNDFFVDNTTVPFSIAATTGTVSSSLAPGSPNNSTPNNTSETGVFKVGTTGQVSIDYMYDGAGYRGQLGIYSLSGMSSYTPGSASYNREAARRILSDSTSGHIAISVNNEAAKFSGTLPWESNFNTGHGSYQGPHTLTMTAGDTFGFMLVPNGLVSEVYSNPSITGNKTPLYSIPNANPYQVTSAILGAQAADLDGRGSLFSFEDIRLDAGSDRDYNDMCFLVTGATGTEPPAKDVGNTSKNFTGQSVYTSISTYAADQEASNNSSTIGSYSSGVGIVGGSGTVGINYLFDGGGYQSEVAVFSLQGMADLTPGSSAFIKEAARRALTDTTLGHVVISDQVEGARTASALTWESNFNAGTYKGVKNFTMSPGDRFGMMIVPTASVWQVYNNSTSTATTLRPLFSMPEANPSNAAGNNYFASYRSDADTFGFEDMAFSTNKSDHDFNDIVFRFTGATASAPTLESQLINYKNTKNVSNASTILA
jgi:hypothetical protein